MYLHFVQEPTLLQILDELGLKFVLVQVRISCCRHSILLLQFKRRFQSLLLFAMGLVVVNEAVR